MRLALVPLALAACSVVPAHQRTDRQEALEARVAALEALTQPCEESLAREAPLAPLANKGELMGVQVVRFDGTMDDLAPLDGGWATLHRDAHGRFDGYRLSLMRPGSLGDRLGLQNGDVVHAVNGLPVRSRDEAMRAYEAVSSTDLLELLLTRRGLFMELQVLFATP